jgi:hypothetical protein
MSLHEVLAVNDDIELDRSKIEEAFRIMGQYLLDRKTLGEIAVYGGSAILLQFDWRMTSHDVDARVLSQGNHGLVSDAAAEAAKRLRLPRSWLNESVTMYVKRGEDSGDRTFLGVYPSPERVGLRVVAAKPIYILAMKIAAIERVTLDDRDFRDAVNLALECGIRTSAGLRNVFAHFFGEEAIPTRATLRLEDLARAIAAKSVT